MPFLVLNFKLREVFVFCCCRSPVCVTELWHFGEIKNINRHSLLIFESDYIEPCYGLKLRIEHFANDRVAWISEPVQPQQQLFTSLEKSTVETNKIT